MKEYVYRDMECLRDLDGNPIRVYIPRDKVDYYDEISRVAYESGLRFKQALINEGVIE